MQLSDLNLDVINRNDKIYTVPIRYCPLSIWIFSMDKWFSRQSYSTWNGLFMLPYTCIQRHFTFQRWTSDHRWLWYHDGKTKIGLAPTVWANNMTGYAKMNTFWPFTLATDWLKLLFIQKMPRSNSKHVLTYQYCYLFKYI